MIEHFERGSGEVGPNIPFDAYWDEFKRRDEFTDLCRRANEAPRFLKANEYQFLVHWVPVIELTWHYTVAA